MNILFFITPKNEVAYIDDTCSLRQAIEKMEYHQYTAVPVLDGKGRYIGTLTEGDLLRELKMHHDLSLHDAEDVRVARIDRSRKMKPVGVDVDIEDLIQVSMRQNFVPVIDDNGVFIGIITRKAIIEYCYEHSDLKKEKECVKSSN
ncbi:MAG: CBS domain-containing protein [Eubacterium sp.]|nr:CBS domain-containing protein [Eubacterium sp.]